MIIYFVLKADISLVNTKKFNLSELSAENVFGDKYYCKLTQQGQLIGLEFNGVNCISVCHAVVQQMNLANGMFLKIH